MRKDLDETSCKLHEKCVQQIMETICSMSNPFSSESPTELVNICSGVVADENTSDELTDAYIKGNEKAEQFMESKILCEEPDIFSPLTTMKLRTFKTITKPKATKTASGKIVPIKNDCKFWARLVLIAKNQKLDLREVFSYSLRSYPRALASDSGGLNKTAKSKLLHVLESEANQPLVDVIPQQCTTIIDAMALLQILSVKDIPGTFAQLADQVLKKVIHIARYNNSERVDFVSDRYPVVSTKNAERINPAASGTQSVTILNGNQKVPRQW